MYTIVMDLETTGLSTINDEPIQACWTVFDKRGRLRRSRLIYINTSKTIHPKAMEVHKITHEFLHDNGVKPAQAAEAYTKLIWEFQPAIIIGYNILGFDFPMWQNFMVNYKSGMFKFPPVTTVIDVLHMASQYFRTKKRLKQAEAGRRLGLTVVEADLHDARADNELCWDIYQKLIKE